MNFAVVYCPVSFSAMAILITTQYVFAVVARCNRRCVYVHTICVMILPLYIALYPSVQMAILITTYSQLLCDATDAVYTLRTDMCYDYAAIYCPVPSVQLATLIVYSQLLCTATDAVLCTLICVYDLCRYIYCPVSSVQPAILINYVFTVDVAMLLTLCFVHINVTMLSRCPVSFRATSYPI